MVSPEWTGSRAASSVANPTTPHCLLVTSFERVLVWILKAALQIQQHGSLLSGLVRDKQLALFIEILSKPA